MKNKLKTRKVRVMNKENFLKISNFQIKSELYLLKLKKRREYFKKIIEFYNKTPSLIKKESFNIEYEEKI
jgi:hypothetical protein